MNAHLLLTRSDLQYAYRHNPVEALTEAMFITGTEHDDAALMIFIDNIPGAIRICKVLRNRGGIV